MTKFYALKKTTRTLITSAGALALMAGFNPIFVQSATASECLLDDNTTGGANSGGDNSRLACGRGALALDIGSLALGLSSKAEGNSSIALGTFAESTETSSTAIGSFSKALGTVSIALGQATAEGTRSIAIGNNSKAVGTNAIAFGGDSFDPDIFGAQALGNNSIVIGADASDANFAETIVIGKGATATEVGQIILGSADTFTILNNGNVGLGTDVPADALDITSDAPAFRLTETGAGAGFPIRAKLNNGTFRLSFVDGIATQFEMNPDADVTLKGQSPSLVLQEMDAGGVNEGDPMRLTIKDGTFRMSFVDGIATEFLMDTDGNVTLQGSLTTSGPACAMGCDAVFGADYDLLSIEEHAKAMFANKHLPAIGATKPNAAINVSERMGTMLNELEKAHIYIAQQQVEMTQQKSEMAEIKAQLALLMNK